MTKSWTAPASTTPNTIQIVPGQVAELGGQHRADQRARAGDRGEVVAEEHPAGGRHEVAAVGQPLGRRGPAVVEAEDPVGEEAAVEAEGDEVGADGGEDEPGGADRLAPMERQHAPAGGAGQGDEPARSVFRSMPTINSRRTSQGEGPVTPCPPLGASRTFEAHAHAILRFGHRPSWEYEAPEGSGAALEEPQPQPVRTGWRGKVAIVTGGATGLGRHIAHRVRQARLPRRLLLREHARAGRQRAGPAHRGRPHGHGRRRGRPALRRARPDRGRAVRARGASSGWAGSTS